MERIDVVSGPNGLFFGSIVVTTILFAWAALGALRLCLDRYPPRWSGAVVDHDYIRRGRRAWGLCWVFATMVALGIYRGWWLWTHPGFPLPGAGTWVEAFRLAGCLYFVRAYWPEPAAGGRG